jgi:WD40 repeat protein
MEDGSLNVYDYSKYGNQNYKRQIFIIKTEINDSGFDNERFSESHSRAHSDSILDIKKSSFNERIFTTIGKDGTVKVWNFVENNC